MVQKTIHEDALTVGYTTSSKAVAFDKDGVLLNPLTILENGKLVQYYGSNQYANYLNMEPSGLLDTIQVTKGKSPIARLKAKPHLEIIALSGIQIDMYRGYIGGEVRLAVYFDGKQHFPVSGFSFSGNIDQCLMNIKLSKETVKLSTYVGPKVIKLTEMEIL